MGGSGDIGVVMVHYAGYFGLVVVVVTAFVIVVGALYLSVFGVLVVFVLVGL